MYIPKSTDASEWLGIDVLTESDLQELITVIKTAQSLAGPNALMEHTACDNWLRKVSEWYVHLVDSGIVSVNVTDIGIDTTPYQE